MKAFFIPTSLAVLLSSVMASPQGMTAKFICGGPANLKCPPSVPICCLGPLIAGDTYQFGSCFHVGTFCAL
ncbi:hypothetical protein CPC08DRAFT_704963 [Agrocybe pediades]|nr:hypothetical protein CPC08DRAFT_704963 [Agrocybe pediades]